MDMRDRDLLTFENHKAMKIRFTNHAQISMSERGISTTRVIDAIRKPDSRRPTGGGTMTCVRAFGVQKLEIIYREYKKAEYVIITAYYL